MAFQIIDPTGLKDPMGELSLGTHIRVTALNTLVTIKGMEAKHTTDESTGVYDFNIVEGDHEIMIHYSDECIVVAQVRVTSAVLPPMTLPELIVNYALPVENDPEVTEIVVPSSMVSGGSINVSASVETNGGANPVYLWEMSTDLDNWVTTGFANSAVRATQFTYTLGQSVVYLRFTLTTDDGEHSLEDRVLVTTP